MNKLTKIGATALCGSLAAVSANAGEMAVTGGATMTHTTIEGAVTGNPLGMATGLTFEGSGELDNGSSVKLTIGHDDKNTYSTSAIAYTTPGVGTFTFDQGGGTGLDRLDDKMPSAWEEAYDTGNGSGLATVAGAGGSLDIEWAVDTGFLPDGMSAYVSYSPMPNVSTTNDKASGGDSGSGVVNGMGWDIVVEHSAVVDGLNLFAGYSDIEQVARIGDRKAWAIGGTYAVGSITVGYQQSKDMNPGVVGDTTDYYDNTAYGITFQVNDDLSISYSAHESDKVVDGNAGNNVTAKDESFQMAYSMGGATIKFAETSTTNSKYSTAAANDFDGTTIAVSLAF